MTGPTLDPRVARGMVTQLGRWRALVARGVARVGWKIGINDPRMQHRLGLERPVVGHLTLATALVPGEPHSLAGGTQVGVEPEVAIHLGRDVPAGAERAVAEAAIIGLGAALEVIDLDGPLDDVERIVAGSSFHRAVLIGPTNPRHAGGVLAGVMLRFSQNGETLAEGPAAGDLPALVQLVADTLGTFGEGLRAGEWIISGALARQAWVQPGDVVRVDLGPLGSLELRCTP